MTKPMKHTLIVLIALALLLTACGSAPATTAPAVSTETPAPIPTLATANHAGIDQILVDDRTDSIVMSMPAPDNDGWLLVLPTGAYRYNDNIGMGCYHLIEATPDEQYGTAIRTGDTCQ